MGQLLQDFHFDPLLWYVPTYQSKGQELELGSFTASTSTGLVIQKNKRLSCGFLCVFPRTKEYYLELFLSVWFPRSKEMGTPKKGRFLGIFFSHSWEPTGHQARWFSRIRPRGQRPTCRIWISKGNPDSAQDFKILKDFEILDILYDERQRVVQNIYEGKPPGQLIWKYGNIFLQSKNIPIFSY